MKELSIEEKAKAYDRVSKEVKDFFEGRQKMYSDINKTLEYLFPELAESEDERIREEIIQTIKRFVKCVEDEHDTPEAKNILLKDIEKKIAWLEKQGGTFTKKDVDDAYLKGISDTKDELEKQDEQKSSIEVKPKFKVGDWILYSGDHYEGVRHITKIDENGYYINRNGLPHGIIPFNHEICMKLWAIKDAKDGDVLVYHNTATEIIMLFKSWVVDRTAAYTHFHIFDNDYKVNDSCDCGNGAHPATKEQSDLLFQKMKEAGYMWDAEKKELKKIVAPKFDIHDCIIKKHNSSIDEFGCFYITDITDGKYWYNDIIICNISEQDDWELYEPVRQIEVKEVDLDKEFDKCCGNYIFDDEYDVYIAKRFFKLGLKAQIGE